MKERKREREREGDKKDGNRTMLFTKSCIRGVKALKRRDENQEQNGVFWKTDTFHVRTFSGDFPLFQVM